jgi:hypothetical protein
MDYVHRMASDIWWVYTPLLSAITDDITIGDVVSLQGLGQSIIILNSQESIRELLEARGARYSDRPVFTFLGEMMGLDNVSGYDSS